MSDTQIATELDNYERHIAADGKLTPEQKERHDALRKAGAARAGFDWETSLAFLTEAARDGRFVSYGDLAAANGLDWQWARRRINSHLWDLVRFSNGRYGFMFSAIVVDKPNVATGLMSAEALAGFVRAAEALGHRVDDPVEFLRDQQRLVFEKLKGSGG